MTTTEEVIRLAREAGVRAIIDSKFNRDDYTSVQSSFPALVRLIELVRAEENEAIIAAECDEPCTPDDLRLIICTPNYLREVDLCEDNVDDMPEDGDESCFTTAVQVALEMLNKAIRESRTPEQAISWSPGKTKPKAGSIDITEELEALVSE